MSPIASAARVASRRQFSLLTQMRTVARSFEPHPFQRLPITHAPAKPDYRNLFSNAGKQAIAFTGVFTAVMTWPLFVEAVLDGHI